MKLEEVNQCLDQLEPYPLVDKIIDIQVGQSLTCIKNVSGSEPYFQGHFPEIALMPGVLLVECMNQASLILLCSEGKKYAIHKVNKCRFLNSVHPGDQLYIHAQIEELTDNDIQISIKIYIFENLVSKGKLKFIKCNKPLSQDSIKKSKF